jgi:hypothetical protein
MVITARIPGSVVDVLGVGGIVNVECEVYNGLSVLTANIEDLLFHRLDKERIQRKYSAQTASQIERPHLAPQIPIDVI